MRLLPTTKNDFFWMGELLKPAHLNLDHIFGHVLLALNDSFCIAEITPEGQLVFSMHERFWEKLGFDKNKVDDQKWMDLIQPEQLDVFKQKLKSFIPSKESAMVAHFQINDATQHKFWYVAQVVKLGDGSSQNQSLLFMLKDNSSRMREKERLKHGQYILRMGYWELNIPRQELYWSQTTKELHGVPADYIPNLDEALNFYKKGSSRIKVSQQLNDSVENGSDIELEAELVRADGTSIWVEVRGKTDFENGECVHLYGTIQDITKRKSIENNLRISEESFRGAFENATIGMALVAPDGSWIRVNKSVCDITGYKEKELLQLTFQDITHPDDLDSDIHLLEELVAGKRESYTMEKRYFHKNGHIVWVILSVSMVKNIDGKPLYFVSQITDISKRKQAFDELQRALYRIRGIIDASTHVSIISTNTEGLIVEFNKGAENLLGYKASEVINQHSPIIIHDPEEVEKRGELLSAHYGEKIEGFDVFIYKASRGFHDSSEWTYIRKDGTRFPVQLVVTAIKNEENDIIGYLGMATDLTERKKAEHLLNQMSILESKSQEMEQFAYITSHDLREPLLTITNYISLMQSEFDHELTDNTKKFFQYISNAAVHLTQLINGLLEYSRLSNVQEKESVPLNDLANQVVANLQNIISTTDAKVEIEGELPTINGYKNHLYVLLQNLIQNGLKFRAIDRKPHLVLKAEKVKNGWIISCKDNGIGIDEKHQGKIFTIFQRLHGKGEFEGTGIGLALATKIAELHGGKIWVESEKGKGSTFFVSLQD